MGVWLLALCTGEGVQQGTASSWATLLRQGGHDAPYVHSVMFMVISYNRLQHITFIQMLGGADIS